MAQKLRINVHLVPCKGLEKDQNIALNVHTDTSWSDVCKLIKEKVNSHPSLPLTFQYLDEDADFVSGCTEEEWKHAIASGGRKSRNEHVLPIEVVPTEDVCKMVEKFKKDPPVCCTRDDWCCFDRPIPSKPEDDDVIPASFIVYPKNPDLDKFKYANDYLWAVTLPLGPLGGGSIALAGDGGLRQWQVENKIHHTAHVPDSFFGIKVSGHGHLPGKVDRKALILQSNALYEKKKPFQSATYVDDDYVPPNSVSLLKKYPGVKTVEVTAKYPIVEVDFHDKEFKDLVDVRLEAFNPCIPLDTKNSGIPVIIFNYKVTNRTSKPLKVSMLACLRNFIGWNEGVGTNLQDNPSGTEKGDKCYFENVPMPQSFYEKVQRKEFHCKEYAEIRGFDHFYLCNSGMDNTDTSNGNIVVGVLRKDADETSSHIDCKDLDQLWQRFELDERLSGEIPPCEETADKPGLHSALKCSRIVYPHKPETFTFFWAWHFPNRYSEFCWERATSKLEEKFGTGGAPAPPQTMFFLGNYYATMWPTVDKVMDYVIENIDDLTFKTRQFRDAMFNSSIPWQLIDSAAGRVSVPRSPTFMWNADGNFHGFEGCSTTSGCCPMNCTHVLNYEMTIAKCFPSLERIMRAIDLGKQIAPNAIMPSRTKLPLFYARPWEHWNWWNPDASPVALNSCTICLDGDLGTVLKFYREIRQGASLAFFNTYWPRIKKMMARYMNDLDNGEGVIVGWQPCTYDRATYGVDTFIGCLYLCALRAAQEMAKLQKENDLAEKYYQRFVTGSRYLDAYCFRNKKWFTQAVDPKHPENTLGCATFVDALIGQWWAHSLGLGYLLPKDHIRSHLSWVFKRNHVDAFDPKTQKPRPFFDRNDAGLQIGYWDVAAGEKVPKVPLCYSFEGAWSGLEYSFAGLLLYEGMTDIALQVVRECREKYDGARRSPWNEIECGDHYARAMASFLFFEIAAGMTWDLVAVGQKALKLNFAPIKHKEFNQEDFQCFFVVCSGWGIYHQKIGHDSATVKLEVISNVFQIDNENQAASTVEINTLGLDMNFSTAKTVLDKKEIKTVVTKECGKILLSFPGAPLKEFPSSSEHVVIVEAGKTLEITLSN